jgi:hypothetical protein
VIKDEYIRREERHLIREDERTEFKKTTGELNEAMVSVSAMLNKHKKGKVYESIKPQLIPIIDIKYQCGWQTGGNPEERKKRRRRFRRRRRKVR